MVSEEGMLGDVVFGVLDAGGGFAGRWHYIGAWVEIVGGIGKSEVEDFVAGLEFEAVGEEHGPAAEELGVSPDGLVGGGWMERMPPMSMPGGEEAVDGEGEDDAAGRVDRGRCVRGRGLATQARTRARYPGNGAGAVGVDLLGGGGVLGQTGPRVGTMRKDTITGVGVDVKWLRG